MTDIRTNAPNLDTVHQNTPQGGAAQAKGTFKAAEVHVIDQNSLIADAAEELTSSLSEETEKDVSERDVEEGRKSDSLERFMQLTEINEIMKSLGDLNKKDLHRGLKALLQRGTRDPGELRERAREQFEEPSHQYAALKTLVEALKARGAPPEEIEAAEKALASLMEDEGKSIRAALNVGGVAKGFEKSDLGDVADLRDAYRTNIHDYKSVAATLDDLVKRFGEGKLQQSIEFMMKALASDLEAAGSSIDKTQLGLIMNDLNRLKTMSTMLSNCGFLMRNARDMGAKSGFSPVTLLREIAPLQDAPRVHKDQMTAIPEKAGLDDIEHQIRFLNDLRELIRLIPLESYAKPESREKLLDAINDAITEKGDLELAMEEEEEYDE